MASPRFIVAKYVGDLRRMEPRNFGVILWTEGAVCARFLGENGQPGRVRVPRSLHVKSKNAYRQWVEYWRNSLERGTITDRKGLPVSVDTSEFVDALLAKSKRNYMLTDGGFLLDKISDDKLSSVLDELFEQIVETPSTLREHADRGASDDLRRECESLFVSVGIKGQRTDFHQNSEVFATFDNEWQGFRYDYVIGNGTPESVFQRVLISQQKSVANAIVTLGWIQEAKSIRLPVDRCAAIVHATDADHNDKHAQFNLRLLGQKARIIDIADEHQAKQVLREIARVNGQS